MKKVFNVVLLLILICLNPLNGFRVFEMDGVKTILVLQNETVNVECFNTERCFIKINATKVDTGLWKCHIGRKAIGLEITQVINIRVVNHVAAIQQNVTGRYGKTMTLACTTVKGLMPMSYCRFEPPNGVPFSIGPDVKATNPIHNRYYYPEYMSLDRGDCAVTILNAQYEDTGLWTCGAGLDDGKEHIDVISVEVESFYALSRASTIGVASGVIGALIFLSGLGFIVWRKHRLLGSVTVPRETPKVAEEHVMEYLSGVPSAPSQISPRLQRIVPLIVIQPPSDASGSPISQ